MYRHHIRVEVDHDPERTGNDKGHDQQAKDKCDDIIRVVRVGADIQEEHQVNAHLSDGQHGEQTA